MLRHRTRQRRFREPLREVLAAWIVASFALGVGLSLLALHERDGRNDGVAPVMLRWYAPSAAGTTGEDEVACRAGFRLYPSELPAEADATDPTIARSGGDNASWCSFSNPGGEKPWRCC